MQGSHGRLVQEKTMCSQIIYTPEWERVTSATGTDCYTCVLKGGNNSLYEYISVIYTAVRAVLLRSSRDSACEGTESFWAITHNHTSAKSAGSLQLHLEDSDPFAPGTEVLREN